uniref:Uncharacterized protein n=1 Tax=Anguilla anguilla TaxID=7936 RepID=A0A0E9S897_ANGAN
MKSNFLDVMPSCISVHWPRPTVLLKHALQSCLRFTLNK